LAPESILKELKNDRSRTNIKAFLKDDDEKVLLSTDIPERLHRRYMACPKADIELEGEWIFNKMTPKKKKSSKSKSEESPPISKEEIKKILRMLRIQNFEVFGAPKTSSDVF